MKEKSYLFGKCCMCVLQEDYLIPWKAVLISVYNDLVRKVRLALFYKWEKKNHLPRGVTLKDKAEAEMQTY